MYSCYLVFVWMIIMSIFNFCMCDSYGFAQISDLHIGIPFSSDLYDLKDTVNKVNEKIEEHNLKFALVTGDFAHTGKSASMELARDALDQLEIPYLVAIGNHDIYGPDDEEYFPTGDERFKRIFSKSFENSLVTHYTGNTPVDEPTSDTKSYFHNYQVEYDGVVFLILDLNSRLLCHSKNPLFCGKHEAVPQVTHLFDFQGGTWEWLKQRLNETSNRIHDIKKLVLVMHHPLHIGWTEEMKFGFRELILSLDNDTKSKLEGDISGHLHSARERKPKYLNMDESLEYNEHIGGATKEGVYYRIFQVSESGEFTKLDFHHPSTFWNDVLVNFSIFFGLVFMGVQLFANESKGVREGSAMIRISSEEFV